MHWFLRFLAGLVNAKPSPPAPSTCGVAVIVREDSNTGAPVVGASVRVGTFASVTNRDGYVAFVGVPKGVSVTVTVSHPDMRSYAGAYTFQAQNQDVPIAVTRKVVEAALAPREYVGNMCGVRVGVDRYGPDAMCSWLYDRWDPGTRAGIRAAHKAKGYVDFVLSWPDSRAAGATVDGFLATCQELIVDGFRPVVMLLSKDYDPHDDEDGCWRALEALLPRLATPRACSRVGVAWEASLWMSPTIHANLCRRVAAVVRPAGIRVYCHFQEGYGSYQEDGGTTADFWNPMAGVLDGLFHQRNLRQGKDEYRTGSGGIVDMLERFAGNFGFTAPFDFIAWEITAQPQYQGAMSEAEGDDWGRWAIDTPSASGPFGEARVLGSGNGR